jgi:hypothetical protein
VKPIITALTLSGALLAAAAAAEPPAMTAGDLAQLCSGADHVSRNACRIYILGVTQGISLGMRIADGKAGAARPCVPAGVSADAVEQTVKDKLAGIGSAAERGREASGFIGAILISAFRCSKAGH